MSEAKARIAAAAARIASPVAVADELEVEVEKLVAGGDGLARYENLPIFVPRSAPGDRLRVHVVERRADYARAEIVEVLRPGPGRRAAPCPYFSRCGGCDLQHLEDAYQLKLKAEAARETLTRIGRMVMPAKITVVAGEPWAYRLRTQLQLEKTERGVEAGYFARASHDLVPVAACPILLPELEAMLPQLPLLLRDQTHRRLDLTEGDDGQLTSAPKIEGLPHGEVSMTVGGLAYNFDARCFFQAHRQLLPALVEHGVGTWEGKEAYDLYSGVGLFALPLAARYQRVVAVEGDRNATRFARRNAQQNGLRNVHVETRALDSWIDELPAGVARVVVDPPRAGLPLKVRRRLKEQRPQRLTYVSCHVATLARDLAALASVFEVESLALLDMFPQTGHLEAVVQLVARTQEAG